MRNKDAAKKKSRRDKNVDMEKLADGLQKLGEDDLLHVVTMVHDNKTSETYTKNDVESRFWFIHIAESMLTVDRRRVPCRSLHSTRFARQDALGLHGFQSRVIDSSRDLMFRHLSRSGPDRPTHTISCSHVHNPSQHIHA
jgi:hypothetical protein